MFASGLHRHAVRLCMKSIRRTPLNDSRFVVFSRSVHFVSDEKSSFTKIDNDDLKVGPSLRTVVDVDLSEFNESVPYLEIPEQLLTGLDIGLAWWAPTNVVFNALTGLHDSLPWIASIAVLSLTSRLLALPLMIINMRHSKIILAETQIAKKVAEEFHEARKEKDETKAIAMAQKLVQASLRQQLKIITGVIPFMGTGFLYSTNFFTLRAMADYPIPSFKEGGYLWFLDLTAADPYTILPAMSAATTYFLLKSGAETPAGQSAKVAQVTQIVFCPLIYIGGTMFPSVLSIYWLMNNVLALVQVLLLRSRPVRNFFGLEDIKPSDQDDFVFIANETKVAAALTRKYVTDVQRASAMKRMSSLKKSPSSRDVVNK